MKRLTLILWILFIAYPAKAQDRTLLSIQENISKQLEIYPQEKIHLHIDRPSYITGEVLWFRAYLLDAASHVPFSNSRYVYVELINEALAVVGRVKVKPDDNNLHHGYIKLPEELPEGNYKVRAYTRYLSNHESDYFYSKEIKIFNPDKESVDKNIKIRSNYDVMFFPEGGYLLSGTMCAIAFKAINESGLSEWIEGDLIDSDGKVLQSVKSFHDGMGVFSFIPVAEEKYYLNCKSSRGKIKRFELPKAENNAYSLSVGRANDSFYVSIQSSVDNQNVEPLLLLVHGREQIQYLSFVEDTKTILKLEKDKLPSGVVQILLMDKYKNPLSERLIFIQNADNAKVEIKGDKADYTSRNKVVIRTKLLDGKNNPMAGNYSVSVVDGNDVVPDTTSTILTTMLLTSELKGDIINPSFYFQNSTAARHALDLLMLTQGWRRYDIPNAVKGNLQTPTIDFERSQSISGIVESEGVFKNSKVREGQVVMLVPDASFIEEMETDETGRFVFDNFELPDSLKYIVQSLNKKGKRWVSLELDQEVFPRIDKSSFKFDLQKSLDGASFYSDSLYVAKSYQRFILENGIRTINLKEIEVTADRKERQERSVYATGATRSYDSEYIEKGMIRSVEDLLWRIPGVRITGGSVHLRGIASMGAGGSSAAIIIDDIFFKPDTQSDEEMMSTIDGQFMYDFININEIERVDIVYASAILGSRGLGGAIVITTKKGPPKERESKTKNIVSITPLGYQTPAEFYSPKYETVDDRHREKPDLRTTIYWKPDVIVAETGKAEFDFYTADTPSVYQIVVEGVSDDGKIFHQVATINVRD